MYRATTHGDINLVWGAFCKPFKCMLIRTLLYYIIWQSRVHDGIGFRVAAGYTDCHRGRSQYHQFIYSSTTWAGNLFNNICTQANSTPANASVFLHRVAGIVHVCLLVGSGNVVRSGNEEEGTKKRLVAEKK